MTGIELFLGGMAALAVTSVVVKARAGARRAAAAAEIARVGTSSVSLLGRVLLTAAVIVGVQWLVIMHPGDRTLLLTVLAVPALIASSALVRALTVFEVRPSRSRGRR